MSLPGQITTTRRELLGTTAVSAVALASARCATTAAAGHRLPDSPLPPSQSHVAVVRTTAHASHRQAVEAALALAGGLWFIRPGQRVLLKPCLNSGNGYPATADPETLLIVATKVREAGGDPFIADRTMMAGSTDEALRRTGMLEAATQAAMDCLALEHSEWVLQKHPLAAHWPAQSIPIYRPVVEADHIINFCTPRTHSSGDFTMALKNNVGVVEAKARSFMHLPRGFKQRVAEIALVAAPSLVVMDGRQGFTNGGPDQGDLAQLDFVAVGTDPVAVDAVGIGYLRMAGTNDAVGKGSLWQIPILARAVALGAGVGEAARIRLSGLGADDEAALRRELG